MVMLEYSVPLRLEPPLYFCIAPSSPTMQEMVGGFNNLDTSLAVNMISAEAREELLVATRDMLVFASPGNEH